MSSVAPDAPNEGSLAAVSAAQIMAEAWRDQRTGCLRITRERSEFRLHVLDGAPTGLEAPLAADVLAQNLEDAHKISAVQRAKVETAASERGCSQASAVHALGLLDAKSLYQALRDATRHQICEIFDWRQGEYVWTPPPADAKASGKPFDILRMLQEELPRRWGIDRLFQALMPRSDDVCELVPRVRSVAQQLGTSGPMARRMIDGLDGATSIGRLLGDSSGDPLAASTLWILLNAGLVRASRMRASQSPEAIEFEVVIDETPNTSTGASQPRSSMDAAAKGNSDAKTTGRADALRAEVIALIDQLGVISHYEALGLEVDAGPTQIKKAYFQLAKKFHPDVLARLDLDDIRAQTDQVFARISEAFEILSNADKRAAYDRGDVEATEIDTARLAQAETSFRKGEILLKMGNFRGAIEFLEPAVDLWPEEPAYQAALGWALFKQPQREAARAKEHLSMAHDQEPENARTLFQLGTVLSDLGENEAAEQCIVRARSIDPDVTD
jgi:tetratricopeptide (TPR) repeat protein